MHTPEPWRIELNPPDPAKVGITLETVMASSLVIGTADGKTGIAIVGIRDRKVNNAERIVACVNACVGMEDPEETIRNLRKAVSNAGL